MKMIKKILIYFIAAFLLFSAVMHLVSPDVYAPMIPDFIPENLANILAFVTELFVGVLLLVPKYRHLGGLGFMLLMMAFLPIHIWDLFRDDPMITPMAVAVFRVILQLAFIYFGWHLFQSKPAKN